jgi:hypothetical protein
MNEIKFKYEGEGVAKFSDPLGIVKGPITIIYNEFGTHTITMQITGIGMLNSTGSFAFDLINILRNEESQNEMQTPSLYLGFGDKIVKPEGFTINPCVRLQANVTDDTGIKGFFNALDINSCSFASNTITLNEPMSITWTLSFNITGSEFVVKNTNYKYWRMGLINFAGDIPAHTPKSEIAQLLQILGVEGSNSEKRFIGFEYEGSPAFIELVTDYEARMERLEARHEHGLVTAIMVGELPISINPNLDKTVPLPPPSQLLVALAFATGTEVGYSYLEILDANGNIALRLHEHLLRNSYYIGYSIMRGVSLTNFGTLLTKFLQHSKEPALPNLEVLATYIVRTGALHLPVEDRLAYAFRTLDGLCKYYGYDQQNLMASLEDEYQKKLKGIITEARGKLAALRKEADADTKNEQSRILERVGSKLDNIQNIDKDSGLLICELLKLFSLPDADVVDLHYQMYPRPDGAVKWSKVLSKYRGNVIHESYFGFNNSNYDFEDVSIIIQHLEAVLKVGLRPHNA